MKSKIKNPWNEGSSSQEPIKPTSITALADTTLTILQSVLHQLQTLHDEVNGAAHSDGEKMALPASRGLAPSIVDSHSLACDIQRVVAELSERLIG